MKKIFENRKIALLTKHKKEKAIKPVLEKTTGCELIVETRFDTDKLGTFSREIKRPKSKLDTARMKIRRGMKLLKTDIGIASEGSVPAVRWCMPRIGRTETTHPKSANQSSRNDSDRYGRRSVSIHVRSR